MSHNGTSPGMDLPGYIERKQEEERAVPAHCSADLRAGAENCFRIARQARREMVRLAPQYRKRDEYNAEGEYLETIRIMMRMRAVLLRLATQSERQNAELSNRP